MLNQIKISRENIITISFSLLLAITSFLFLNLKTGSGYLLHSFSPKVYYAIYFISIISILAILRQYLNKKSLIIFLTKIIFITLLAEIVFLWKLTSIDPHYTPLHWMFHFLPTLWIYLASFLIIHKLNEKLNINISPFKKEISFKKWIKKQGRFNLAMLGIIITLSFGFGLYNIQKAAIVDEALWTFDRIPSFWKNVGEQDWYGARVSDKPGMTVAAISGISLLKIENPKEYDTKDIDPKKIESLNFAFRFPILFFVILMLPIIYFFTERLLGRNPALISTAFIALSPILIGMTRMLNPDALLWIFTTISLLAFLTFLEKKKDSAIIWSGVFLGLSLLTKYVSNFLYIFFLGLIFLKYIFDKSAKENPNNFFRKNLFSYIVMVFISLVTFFLAYPATWTKPDRIILGTATSQAFGPIFPYFSAILLLFIVDTFILKNAILKTILNFISNYKSKLIWLVSGSFILFSGIAFWNAYAGNPLFDLSAILSSPKSSYRDTNSLWFMTTNFYPLIFGISPIALLATLYYLLKSFSQNNKYDLSFRVSFYLIIFILLYFAGSVFSHVSATIRYQIILYPLILIISGIWFSYLASKLKKKKYYLEISVIFLIFILSSVLLSIKPFYFSYTSILLPQKYHIDYKDMGVGSYEAADYLNSLPNADKLSIWSDKKGVCMFFIGKCNSKFDEDDLAINYDYYVLSSGRESLTSKKIDFELNHGHPDTPRIDTLYSRTDTKKTLDLANRPSNYIKIFDGGALEE